MARPASREALKDYCLRKLGYPVVQINVDDAQMEDRIDDALQFFAEYHFDGVEKVYMRKQITQIDIDRGYINLTEPTPADGTNSTRIATTEFVQTAINSIPGPNLSGAKWQGSAKFVATTDPTSSDGVDGDFWFKYS